MYFKWEYTFRKRKFQELYSLPSPQQKVAENFNGLLPEYSSAINRTQLGSPLKLFQHKWQDFELFEPKNWL